MLNFANFIRAYLAGLVALAIAMFPPLFVYWGLRFIGVPLFISALLGVILAGITNLIYISRIVSAYKERYVGY